VEQLASLPGDNGQGELLVADVGPIHGRSGVNLLQDILPIIVTSVEPLDSWREGREPRPINRRLSIEGLAG
jgi:hypothetical protein